MTDLEDKILKKNIPGKYSWWDKDSDDLGGQTAMDAETYDRYNDDSDCSEDSNEGLTDIQRVQKMEKDEVPKPLQIQALANLRSSQQGGPSKNTGVKGVKEDYKNAKKQMELDYEIEQQMKQMLLERISSGATLNPGEKSISAATMLEIERRRKRRDDSDSDDEYKRDDDTDFMDKYRQSRLSQLRYGTHFPTFGEIREVDPFEFAEEVDSTDARVHVVVHMYEPYVPACKELNKIFEELARRMPYAKFLRLHAFKANSNLDPVALPILMIHKGGELLHNLVHCTDELPKDFTLNDVKDLLEYCGVLDPSGEENAKGSVRKTDREEEEEEQREIEAIESKLRNADWNAMGGGMNAGGGKQVIGNLYEKHGFGGSNNLESYGNGNESDSDDLDEYLDGYED